jgi:predicted Zn-dependent peptidase
VKLARALESQRVPRRHRAEGRVGERDIAQPLGRAAEEHLARGVARHGISHGEQPVQHGPVVEYAARALAGRASGTRVIVPAAPPPITGPRLHHVKDAGSQTSLAIVFRAVPELDPAYVALVALLRVLDDGMSTRLHYTLSDQKGLAYAPQAGVDLLADTALFEISAATANAKVPTLVREVLALLDGLRAGNLTDDELAKVRVRFRYDALASMDDAGAIAGPYGSTALYFPTRQLLAPW